MKKLILLIAFLFTSSLCFGQSKGASSFDMENIFKGNALKQLNNSQLSKASAMPVGNIVDDNYYLVGPGDVLIIQNLTALSQKNPIVISPENSVIVPRIGMLDLTGKTLADAKNMIIEAIKNSNPKAKVYISLYHPRNVVIEVSGNVEIPGTYTFPASFRISTVIKFANQQKSSNLLSYQQNNILVNKLVRTKLYQELFSNSGMPYVSSYFSRNITVVHNDGQSINADLEKSQFFNDSKYDPYINEGDKIYVPFNLDDYPVITIAGSVLRPAVLPFKIGDKASLLLKFGGGLKQNADLNKVKLFLPESNKTINLKIDDKLNLLSEDVNLESGSIITIGEKVKPKIKNSGVVSVVGEVNEPGVYTIDPNKTKLKDIINMAGGFTENAYLPLAYVIRRDNYISNSKTLNYRLLENFQHSNLTAQDTTRFKIDMLMRQPTVSTDFVAVFDKNVKSANITLKDGDVIKIPSNPKSVYVYGQVRNPGYVPYVENKTMDWYIAQAGGYTESAEKSASRIIRGKNKSWVADDSGVFVFAGDQIYVPAPPYIPPEVKAQTWTMLIGAITSVATLINVLWYITR